MKRAVLPLAAAAGAVGVARSLPALAPLIPQLAKSLDIPLSLPGGGQEVAITFDDGPHPEGTPAVLDLLAERGMVATFFLVGERVRAEPALAAEIAARGHRIALHCDLHRNALRLTAARVRDDLARARETIATATGVECDIQRAPLGIYTRPFLAEVRAAGLQPWLWSQWGRDWRARATAESIVADSTSTLKAGDVVLLHDGDNYSAAGSHRRTVAALPAILDAVEMRSLSTVAIP
ncbi:MAG: polysaccharide deacetylase family protein [Actinomycetes bacterium]